MPAVDPILQWKQYLISDLSDRIKDVDILKRLDPESDRSNVFLSSDERKKARVIRCSILIAITSHFEQFVKKAFQSALSVIDVLSLSPNTSMRHTAIRKFLRSIKQPPQQTESALENLIALCANLAVENPPRPLGTYWVSRIGFNKKGINQAFGSIGIDNVFQVMGERVQDSTELCLTIDRAWNPHRTAAYLESVISMLTKRNELVHTDFGAEITIGDAQRYDLVTREFLEGTILVLENLLRNMI